MYVCGRRVDCIPLTRPLPPSPSSPPSLPPQVTSVAIKTVLGDRMSLNDVCCLVPAWFGALATLLTGLMAYEACVGTYGVAAGGWGPPPPLPPGGAPSRPQPYQSVLAAFPVLGGVYRAAVRPLAGLALRAVKAALGSGLGLPSGPELSGGGTPAPPASPPPLSSPAVEAMLASMAIMAIVPAHIMRSMGGGYDNESVAMTAMTLVFYLWMRSLRGGSENAKGGILYGSLAGLAYFNMAAAWGGYVFVLNLVGVHAAVLFLLGRYSTKLHRAYSAFFAVGTALAVQIPVVGWTPLKSLEQLGPFAVFVGFQLMEYCEVRRRGGRLGRREAWRLRLRIFGGAALLAAVCVALLLPTGHFGPISSRVRGLFVKHTKTGNPLVDSVAEHQPGNIEAYVQYLQDAVYVAPVGFVLVALFYFHDSSSFLLVYGVAAYFFSHRMVRLVLLTAPIASALSGVAIGRIVSWMLGSITEHRPSFGDLLAPFRWGKGGDEAAAPEDAGRDKKKKSPGKKAKTKAKAKGSTAEQDSEDENENETTAFQRGRKFAVKFGRLAVSYLILDFAIPYCDTFYESCIDLADAMSNPTILYKSKTSKGREVLVDDYREAYFWLRDNTPEDARVLAWWDYGYQITGIGNRTTIADGNTWNHEHIALLGKVLTGPEKEGHRIARHLADYVLVWAGGGGDDVAKSPHLARIANSVYRDHCPGDPACRSFGFTERGNPSSRMAESLLYRLHSHDIKPGVEADRNRFKEVYTTKYGKVRIYKILSVSKESKEWVENNRICDVEGSWHCRGQYPPGLQKVLNTSQDFGQLEDFNKQNVDEDYQKEYFEAISKPRKRMKDKVTKFVKPKQERIDKIQSQNYWRDGEHTSDLWNLISSNDLKELKELLKSNPILAYSRSGDGRGPMFWAHEYGRTTIVDLLRKIGVSETEKDIDGLTPLDDSMVKKLEEKDEL